MLSVIEVINPIMSIVFTNRKIFLFRYSARVSHIADWHLPRSGLLVRCGIQRKQSACLAVHVANSTTDALVSGSMPASHADFH